MNRALPDSVPASGCVLGVDVGGTKTAAGLLVLPETRVAARRVQQTRADRPGDIVAADVYALVESLMCEADNQGIKPSVLGVGVAELVDRQGQIISGQTLPWDGFPLGAYLGHLLPCCVEADVRAAARAEAMLGAGRGLDTFVYVTVGTGISSCLVQQGIPYVGARGMTGTCASSSLPWLGPEGRIHRSPPLEEIASGPGLVKQMSACRPGSVQCAEEVIALASQGDADAVRVVETSGELLGGTIAWLVNVLDPEAVVVGGGLGLAGGLYWSALKQAFRTHVWSKRHRDIPLRPAACGVDAGWMGAALSAVVEKHGTKAEASSDATRKS